MPLSSEQQLFRTKLLIAGKKICCRCMHIKELKCFWASKSTQDGKDPRCKDCNRHRLGYKKRTSHSKRECHKFALLYARRIDFKKSKHNKYYNYARKHNWLDEICSHMERGAYTGAGKRSFISDCQTLNNPGLFYVLKVFDYDESFYKLGITSKSSVSERYSYSNMPYDYEILTEYTDDPAEIWHLERHFKEKIKPYSYMPDIPFGGCVFECFNCNSNSNLLGLLVH